MKTISPIIGHYLNVLFYSLFSSYVQDKIKENSNLIWDTLERGASVFVAGNAKNMPQGVRKAFVDVCMESGNLTETEANGYIQNMENTGRYQTECW